MEISSGVNPKLVRGDGLYFEYSRNMVDTRAEREHFSHHEDR
jgi:hypothetical protein